MRIKVNKGFIFVLVGPSGSGKTTLAKKILQAPGLKHQLIKPASFTTRPKRPGERNGRDYIFVSAGKFQALLRQKKVLEHTRYLGYDYATPRTLARQAKARAAHRILCLDIKGALFVKRAYPARAIIIFIKPPSLRIAKERIVGRSARTSLNELKQRMRLARREIGFAKQCDYCLVNNNLNKAGREIERVIKWTISR